MKKILFFLVMSCCILPISYASSSLGSSINLSSSEFQTYIDKGYISSDKFTSFNECSTQKDRYNLEYPSYKRSDCFVSDNTYKYFICSLNESCIINKMIQSEGTESTQTEQSQQITLEGTRSKIPYKENLDKFILKLSTMRESTTPEKFKKTLDSVVSKLNVLEKNYASNATIKSMIVYLNNGIKGLYEESDIDSFFCELTGACNEVGLNNNTNTKIDWDNAVPTSSTNTSCVAQTINGYTLPARVNGGVSVFTKTVSNNTYEQEFKCNSGTWETKGTEVLKTAVNTNPTTTSSSSSSSSSTSSSSSGGANTNISTSENTTFLIVDRIDLIVDRIEVMPGESIFYSYNVTSEFNYCRFDISNGSGGGGQTFTVGNGKTGGETMSMKGSGYVQLNCTKSGFSVKGDGTDDFSKKINIIVPDKYKCKAETKDGYTFTSEVFSTKKTFRSTQDIRGGTLTYQALFECLSDGTWKLVKTNSTPTINCNDGYIKEGNGCIEFKNPSTKKTYDVAKNAKYICKTYQGDVTFKYSYGSDPTTDNLYFGTSSAPFGRNIRMSLYVGKGSSLNGNLPSTIHSKIGNTYDCNNSNRKVGVTREECQDTYVCKLEGSSTSTSGGTTTTNSSSTSTPTTTIKATASGAPLICNDTSVSSSWYKEKGRCPEQAGIDYWNGQIKILGAEKTKEHFIYAYDEDIKKNSNGLDGMLCPSGYTYVRNTDYCVKK